MKPFIRDDSFFINRKKIWGRHGFDEGIETCGACREGCDSRKTIAVTFIVANDENYALAA